MQSPFYSPSPRPSPVKGEGDIRLFTILSNLKFKFGNLGKRIIKSLKI